MTKKLDPRLQSRINMEYLTNWIRNLKEQYTKLIYDYYKN